MTDQMSFLIGSQHKINKCYSLIQLKDTLRYLPCGHASRPKPISGALTLTVQVSSPLQLATDDICATSALEHGSLSTGTCNSSLSMHSVGDVRP